MITSRHFKEVEFNRCTPPCSLQDMKQSTMDLADRIRDRAGIPIVLTCAHRSREWDKARGRTGTGSHPEGMAFDIRCNTSHNRWKIISAAIAEGATRIGINSGFVHIDNSPNQVQEVVWLY